jgi:hypothetical protein
MVKTWASQPSGAPDGSRQTARLGRAQVAVALAVACSSPARLAIGEGSAEPRADAPVVAAQPGAWFDAQGNLMVVGAGRRLRLVLSAPISACASGFEQPGSAEQLAARASLPFHIVSEACRDTHPAILLAEESATASPAELERSYHEVARCAASDLELTGGWRPAAIEAADPCPLALGLGWRLPTSQELSGLSLDDRKAVAGALFDAEDSGAFGGLLLYARGAKGELALATLSPNAAEQAPALPDAQRDQPFFGASLRCVREAAEAPPLPVLPFAAECLREQRRHRSPAVSVSAPPPAELGKLKAWLDSAQRAPVTLRSEAQLAELKKLLASEPLQRLAREAREERALTERYSELAEGLDDPSVSAGERKRRRDEFDQLRRRLGGQIVQSAESAGGSRAQLGAVLAHLQGLLEAAAKAYKPPKRGPKLEYESLLSRVRELGGMTKP